MANELLAHCSLRYREGDVDVSVNKGSFYDDVAGTDYIQATQIASDTTTSPNGVALDKGNITTLGWCIARNNDAATAINILTAVSGTVIISVPPGATVLFCFGSGVTAPAIRAASSSLTAILEYLLVEA